jgi:hypothetical protein
MSGLSWALLNPALPDGEIVDKFMEDTSTFWKKKKKTRMTAGRGKQSTRGAK